MKKLVSMVTVTAFVSLVFTGGCTHIVNITSDPPGADLTINGQSVGKTPVSYAEKSGFHKEYNINLEKPGYKPFDETVKQDKPSKLLIPSIVGGVILILPFIGILWGYQMPDDIDFQMQK